MKKSLNLIQIRGLSQPNTYWENLQTQLAGSVVVEQLGVVDLRRTVATWRWPICFMIERSEAPLRAAVVERPLRSEWALTSAASIRTRSEARFTTSATTGQGNSPMMLFSSGSPRANKGTPR